MNPANHLSVPAPPSSSASSASPSVPTHNIPPAPATPLGISTNPTIPTNKPATVAAAPPTTTTTGRKFHKLTCANCRRRKAKCSGSYPACSNCRALKERCEYDKPASIAYVRHLERTVEQLTARLQALTTAPPAPDDDSPQYRLQFGDHNEPARDAANRSLSLVTLRHQDMFLPDKGDLTASPDIEIPQTSTSPTNELPCSLTAEERRQVAYAAEAVRSRIHPFDLPAITQTNQNFDTNTNLNLNLNLNSEHPVMHYLYNHFHFLPPAVSRSLLRVFFDDLNNVFKFVYEPPFFQQIESLLGQTDLDTRRAVNTDYFSSALLATILFAGVLESRSTRGSEYLADKLTAPLAAKLSHQTYLLLSQTITQPPLIANMQAFLIQSSNELLKGNLSQAWLFAGIAFRLGTSLGIYTPGATVCAELLARARSAAPPPFGVMEVEARHRLEWTAYCWDKVVSGVTCNAPYFTDPPHTPIADLAPSGFDAFAYLDGAGSVAARLPLYAVLRDVGRICVLWADVLVQEHSRSAGGSVGGVGPVGGVGNGGNSDGNGRNATLAAAGGYGLRIAYTCAMVQLQFSERLALLRLAHAGLHRLHDRCRWGGGPNCGAGVANLNVLRHSSLFFVNVCYQNAMALLALPKPKAAAAASDSGDLAREAAERAKFHPGTPEPAVSGVLKCQATIIEILEALGGTPPANFKGYIVLIMVLSQMGLIALLLGLGNGPTGGFEWTVESVPYDMTGTELRQLQQNFVYFYDLAKRSWILSLNMRHDLKLYEPYYFWMVKVLAGSGNTPESPSVSTVGFAPPLEGQLSSDASGSPVVASNVAEPLMDLDFDASYFTVANDTFGFGIPTEPVAMVDPGGGSGWDAGLFGDDSVFTKQDLYEQIQ